MRVAALIFFITVLSSFTQSEEVETHRSTCFGGKIEIIKQHADQNRNNGSLEVKLPRQSGNVQLIWVKHGETEKGTKITNLKPGYYNLMIIDGSNCQTVIDNILIKESE